MVHRHPERICRVISWDPNMVLTTKSLKIILKHFFTLTFPRPKFCWVCTESPVDLKIKKFQMKMSTKTHNFCQLTDSVTFNPEIPTAGSLTGWPHAFSYVPLAPWQHCTIHLSLDLNASAHAAHPSNKKTPADNIKLVQLKNLLFCTKHLTKYFLHLCRIINGKKKENWGNITTDLQKYISTVVSNI